MPYSSFALGAILTHSESSLFECRLHRCSKPCHPPSEETLRCPFSPSSITHCPCGKHVLTPISASFFSPKTKLVRTVCTDPIPTCGSLCLKPLEGCAHACSARCHTGACPPCTVPLVRPCRCGATTRDVPCHASNADDILCDRVCGALRSCGRHQCTRVCCPLAALAGNTKGKGKRRAFGKGDAEVADEAGLHTCDLVCGRMLGCGNHYCEERDHKGACPPCLWSSFEEVGTATLRCRRVLTNAIDVLLLRTYGIGAASSLRDPHQLHISL